jgi:peptidoglycan/LPS O-acetylase OafA/YrhL
LTTLADACYSGGLGISGAAYFMRLTNLQALRGVACLLVLAFHVAEWEQHRCASPAVCVALPFEYFGYIGVDLFFVLSGFVITWVSFAKLGDRSQLLGFIWRRAWRILPLYWVCWIGVVAAYHGILGIPWLPTWRWFFANVLILPAQPQHLFIPQAWSLAFELLFYAVFAGFFVLPRRVFLPTLGAWSATIAILAVAGSPHPAVRGPIGRCLEKLIDPLVLEFLFGCVAAVAVGSGRHLSWGRTALNVGLLGFAGSSMGEYFGIVHTRGHSLERVLSFGLSCALIVFGATARERTHGLQSPRWLQTVGDASYSIYLVHIVVLEVVQHWLTDMRHDLIPHLLYVAALVIGSLAAGFALHFTVERPLMRWPQRKPARASTIEPLRRAA